MSSDTIAAIGAFLTGMGAVLGAMRSLKRVRKAERDECETRIEEIRNSLKEGYEAGLQVQPRPKRKPPS